MTDSGAERAARRTYSRWIEWMETRVRLGAATVTEQEIVSEMAAIIREETGTQDVAWKVKYAIAKVRAKRGKAMSGHDDEGWWNTADEMEQAVLAALPAAPDEGGKR